MYVVLLCARSTPTQFMCINCMIYERCAIKKHSTGSQESEYYFPVGLDIAVVIASGLQFSIKICVAVRRVMIWFIAFDLHDLYDVLLLW